jgi:hypothetical protein
MWICNCNYKIILSEKKQSTPSVGERVEKLESIYVGGNVK